MIRLDETDEYAAEVPFTLPLATDPLTGLTGYTWLDEGDGTTAEVQLLLPGTSSWVNVATNKLVEKGYGRFAARLTVPQRSVAGIVLVRAVVAGAQPYLGSEIIGTGSGDINEGGTGHLLFYLANAVDPVYGPPLTGPFASLPSAIARVCWPDAAYADFDPALVVEFGHGLYGIPVHAVDAVKGKVYYYAIADGAQRFEGYATILTATEFAVSPDPVPPPDPIESAVSHGDPHYVEHVASALDRLTSQFRLDPWSES